MFANYGLMARFIPTCVGNTDALWRSLSLRPVHPHMRGEHGRCAVWWTEDAGSSPHAWGTHISNFVSRKRSRFIPTCVGNTERKPLDDPEAPVHPHMRGEHTLCSTLTSPDIGSSPHAWGTHRLHIILYPSCRFIPTCVGNTAWPHGPRGRPTVHPHMRGEHDHDAFVVLHQVGSSPHAWGTQRASCCSQSECRFIPTCVGNTGLSLPGMNAEAVHPHMRGEHLCRSVPSSMNYGSSPHAWGTQRPCRKKPLAQRFIPTCVGNTSH